MGLEFWMIGKTNEKYLEQGIAHYQKLLSRHATVQSIVIPSPKNASKLNTKDLKRQEAMSILKKIQQEDYLILLDESGKQLTSRAFANLLETRLNDSSRRTIFLIGGAFGFGQALYQRANQQLSLSKMTFSHQLIRLIFWEQLYRGISILKGLPYHND